MRRFAILLLVLALIMGVAAMWASRTPGGQGLREVGQDAGEAYIYGYPLVLMDQTRRAMLAAPASDTGPTFQTNRLGHIRDLPNADDIAVVRPNRDTLYSIAWLDLSQGPVVLRWPDMGERYWLFQSLDAWTDVVGTVGSRTTAPGPGGVLIAGPGWDGPALPGMQRIQVETEMAWILGRIAVAPTSADMARGHALQDQFDLAGPAIDAPDLPAPSGRPAETVASMAPEVFFDHLAGLLEANPPRVEDTAMVDRLQRLGLEEGQYDPREFGALARQAKARGVSVARTRLVDGVSNLPGGPTGWRTALNLGAYGTDYALRAGVALIGLGANLPDDAIYPLTEVDSQGRALSGDGIYQIRFEAGGEPPARAFWSVTAYNGEGFLQRVNQASTGDRSGLVRGEDGSLTLTISARRPPGAPQSNWIEVQPGEPFQLSARLYDPEPKALSGDWLMPPVERVDTPDD